MLRSDAIKAIQDFLIANYRGQIRIHRHEDDQDISPPYAVVMIGSADNIGENQYEIWDFNVMVATFHDADSMAIEAAEASAAELFAWLQDPAVMESTLLPIVVSWWQPLSITPGRNGSNWQHVAGFQLVAAPPAD